MKTTLVVAGWHRQIIKVIFVAWFVGLPTVQALAQENVQDDSLTRGIYVSPPAKRYYQTCSDTLTEPHRPDLDVFLDAYDRGGCVGTVRTLMGFGEKLDPPRRFCLPDGTNTKDAIQVILSYIEEHPETVDQSFLGVAIKSLSAAWPCRSAQ